ncbi:MAG: sodium/proline symporter [Bacteroidales bacterium]|nr:sodium/proline symporter [Bacteroidales bacterium]
MNFTLIGFILYLIIVLVVGFITYNKNKSHTDFYIAGRKLNPWVMAMSERASGESAWLIVGLPGAAYSLGLMEFWAAAGCVSGILLYWVIIAKDLRVQSDQYNAITLPTFFAEKFDRHKSIIRVISTLILIFFFTFYLAAQFNGAGKVLNVTFGISNITGIIIGTAVIIFYTMMGGFFAVAWTDFVQGILMFGTLVILPIVGFIELSRNDMPLFDPQYATPARNIFNGQTGWAAVALVISGLSWAFGYFGQPHLLVRFMAIKNPGKIKKGRIIAYSWAIPAFTGAMLMGLVGFALYRNVGLSDAENIMPYMANNLLPSWVAGLLISGAIAAMMSTADSQLLVISSSVMEDIYYKTFKKKVSEKSLLLMSRIITVAVGLLGFIIAITSKDLVFALVSYAWAGLGSSFGPVLICILKWKKTTAQGVISGMLTGALTVIIWTNIDGLNGMINARFVSFVFAFAAIYIVSIITKAK